MALKHEFNVHNLMAFLADIAIEEGVFEEYFNIIYENYTNSYSTEERYEDIYEMLMDLTMGVYAPTTYIQPSKIEKYENMYNITRLPR